jgi:hypothetical protein
LKKSLKLLQKTSQKAHLGSASASKQEDNGGIHQQKRQHSRKGAYSGLDGQLAGEF